MEERPAALLLKFPGTNCDEETARALNTVGFDARIIPFSQVDRASLDGIRLVVLSGGFSYGDYIMAGKLAQLEIRNRLGTALREFRDAGGYLLGICNGFQILMRLGILPEGSLIHNTNGRFICQWTGLEVQAADSPFLQGLPARFELPIAHAEGRFVAPEGKAEDYLRDGHVTLTYDSDINGSQAAIAGIQDDTGRAFGLMPHPERFLLREHHYDRDWDADATWGWGYYFFHSLYQAISDGQVPATV